MKAKTAYAQNNDINKIIAEIKEQIGTFDTRLIQFFSSPKIDPVQISKKLHQTFPGIPMIGCTSSGEIISGKMLEDSIVLMAFGPEIIKDIKIEVLTNISSDPKTVDDAFNSFGDYYHDSMANLDPMKYIGIVLIDGLSRQDEKINERIGDLTNITFIGGSAGDDLRFEKTHVFANGEAYSDAAVLALIESNTEFDIIKTQSFNVTDKKVLITKANESNREIIELNNHPAVEEYARLVGRTRENLPEAFATMPLGLVFDGDYFVRSPQKTAGDSVLFYCSIKEGMELNILESTDIINDTKLAIENKINNIGSISALINYNCILRTLELKEKGKTDEYGKLFEHIPTIGLSTYGESYIGHINQTAIMLVFK